MKWIKLTQKEYEQVNGQFVSDCEIISCQKNDKGEWCFLIDDEETENKLTNAGFDFLLAKSAITFKPQPDA